MGDGRGDEQPHQWSVPARRMHHTARASLRFLAGPLTTRTAVFAALYATRVLWRAYVHVMSTYDGGRRGRRQ